MLYAFCDTLMLLLVCACNDPHVCARQVLANMHQHQRTPAVITNVSDADAMGKKKHNCFGDQLQFIFSHSVCEAGWGSTWQRTPSVGECRHLLEIEQLVCKRVCVCQQVNFRNRLNKVTAQL